MQKYFVILFIFLLSSRLCAQTDWERWGKADADYRIPEPSQQMDYSLDDKEPGHLVLKSAADIYWIFISDVDGDNCPFSPSCSAFFMQSVKKTNIIQGLLMFADRFTRDMDIYYKQQRYPLIKSGNKFYDPPSLYTLDYSGINFIPPAEIGRAHV